MKVILPALALIAAVAACIWKPALGPSTPSLPPPAAAELHVSALPTMLARPATRRIVVYVAGDVVRPGLYTLAPGSRANDALVRAGGPKPDADLVAVNLAQLLDDGAEVAIPRIGEARPASRRARGPRRRKHRGGPASRSARDRGSEDAAISAIDLNAADATELAQLPGLGPELAARIVAYRDLNGPFTSVDELADVAGITPHLQDVLAERLVIR